jgi:DNA-binding CsgD family transcriptional regulator
MCIKCRSAVDGVVDPGTEQATEDNLPRPNLGLREREILVAWLLHETKAQAAQELSISESTVKTVIQRIRNKYRSVGRPATTQVMLLIRAIQDGFINVDAL